MSQDHTLGIDGRVLAVREFGASDGAPVLHFHGTPGSRLELAWADDDLRRAGVRLVAFDRPGYGRSTAAALSLTAGAGDGLRLLDELGIDRCPTLGWSGGGPFALAVAAVAPGRVPAVGVMSGAAPFQEQPQWLSTLSDDDKEAVERLPSDPVGAAAIFQRGFGNLRDLSDGPAVLAAFEGALSDRDKRVLADAGLGDAFAADLREAGLQDFAGGGWDNVAWVGDWNFDLAAVRCPVLLWYGDEDLMARPDMARHLAGRLPNASLTMRTGYGHLAPLEHLTDMISELLRAADATTVRSAEPDSPAREQP
jgi:pimeloyl-ACP methyl ester carboxylesterase